MISLTRYGGALAMLGDGAALARRAGPAFAVRFLFNFLPRAIGNIGDMRLPDRGMHILKCLVAFRNGCRPMMAWTFSLTSEGMLGAFCAAVYVKPAFVTRTMLTARLFAILSTLAC